METSLPTTATELLKQHQGLSPHEARRIHGQPARAQLPVPPRARFAHGGRSIKLPAETQDKNIFKSHFVHDEYIFKNHFNRDEYIIKSHSNMHSNTFESHFHSGKTDESAVAACGFSHALRLNSLEGDDSHGPYTPRSAGVTKLCQNAKDAIARADVSSNAAARL